MPNPQPHPHIPSILEYTQPQSVRSESGSGDSTANKTRNSKKRTAAAAAAASVAPAEHSAPSPLTAMVATATAVTLVASGGSISAIMKASAHSGPITTTTITTASAISRSSAFQPHNSHQHHHNNNHNNLHYQPTSHGTLHAQHPPLQLTTTNTCSSSSSNGTNGITTIITAIATNKPTFGTTTTKSIHPHRTTPSATYVANDAQHVPSKATLRGCSGNSGGRSGDRTDPVAAVCSGGSLAKKPRTQSFDSIPSTSSRTPDNSNHTSGGGNGSSSTVPLSSSIYSGLSVTLAHNSNAAAASASGGSSPFSGLKFGYEAQTPTTAASAAVASASAATTVHHQHATAAAASSSSMASAGLSAPTHSSTIHQPVTSAGSSTGLSINVTPSVTPQPIKESPPSSPGSEAGSSATRKRNRQSGDTKDFKIFQNGVHVTHMLGNQLNPSSSVAQKMSDQLSMELEAHSVYTSSSLDSASQLIGPPFPGKQQQHQHQQPSQQLQQQRTGSTGGQASGAVPSLASMLGGNGTPTAAGNTPQSLEQLLERQWEQGSQFLMEQAQHFDSE